MKYLSKRKPRVMQAEAAKRIDGTRIFALLMAMRTGKTKVIVDDWGKLLCANKALDHAIIAPAGAYMTWAGAIADDLPDALMAATKVYIWVSGKRNKIKQREYEDFLAYSGPRVLLINVEALSAVEEARQMLLAYLRQRPGMRYGTIDESVIIKNYDAICTKFILNEVAPLLDWRRILSGLPTPKSPLDIWAQFKFLDESILGFDSFVAFRACYTKIDYICMLQTKVIEKKFLATLQVHNGKCGLGTAAIKEKWPILFPGRKIEGLTRGQVTQEFITLAEDVLTRSELIENIGLLGGYIQTIPKIKSYENITEIHDKIAPHSFRVTLDQCYDMPASDYSFRDVVLTSEQERVYRELKQFATAELESGDHVTANNVITQMLRLHQVLCGHTRDERGGWHTIPENRTSGLVQLLSDYDGKAVVWCSYDHDIRKVTAALEKEFGAGCTARFWGGNRKTREQEEAEFKTNPACRFEVATAAAGGRARTWDIANLVVYYSSTNNLDHRSQSEERVKNTGKMQSIAYVDMRVPNTVDEKIIACLRKKIDMATVINGDNYREWLV